MGATRARKGLGGGQPLRARAGWTLVELLIAVSVLMLAVFASLSTMTSSAATAETVRENTAATYALQEKLSELAAVSVAELVATYNDDPNDDPGGPGTAPGPGFAVEGLEPIEGDPDGMAGEIRLPLTPGGELREDVDAPSFGLPRDLTGDGAIDAADHSLDCVVLPVRVVLRWGNRGIERTMELEALLGG